MQSLSGQLEVSQRSGSGQMSYLIVSGVNLHFFKGFSYIPKGQISGGQNSKMKDMR